MNLILNIIILSVSTIAFFSYQFHFIKKRKKIKEFILSEFNNIKKAENKFSNFLNFKTGYFSSYQLKSWKETYSLLYKEIRNKPFTNIGLRENILEVLNSFIYYFENSENLRVKFNKDFIEKELQEYKKFFNNIENRTLNEQQRKAIVIDEDNNLIIAGAGCGKTTTIVGKVRYIINKYRVSSKKILLISFTNKATNSLKRRAGIQGVQAKTFHKLGKDIIAEVEKSNPDILEEKEFNTIIKKLFNSLISRDNDYLKNLIHYILNYQKIPESQFNFDIHGDYIQYLRDNEYRIIKLIKNLKNEKITYNLEIVKSIEEYNIANFLFLNNLYYEYERPYECKLYRSPNYKKYRPDFTVIQGDNKVYIEHFAVDKNGNVPPFFKKDNQSYEEAKEEYWKGIRWKRELHEKCGTRLIETYSYEMSDDILFAKLVKKLKEVGFTLKKRSPKEIWNILNNVYSHNYFENIISLFKTFINLMKVNLLSIEDIKNIINKEENNKFLKERNLLFLELIKPIYEGYEDYLVKYKKIDFNDMINKATDYVAQELYHKDIKYIIIDEFQDISKNQYRLIKALKNINPDCRLFCVGDDWQSIYGFAGSDITIFDNFQEFFGPTMVSKLETTYRFQEPLITLSNEFILKNPAQVKKKIIGYNPETTTTYEIVYFNGKSFLSVLKEIFEEIINTEKSFSDKKIILLGRYNFDINRFEDTSNESDGKELNKEVFKINENNIVTYIHDQGIEISAQFLTVHKAKGLEADIVIIINCDAGLTGFPCEITDDPILDIFLGKPELIKYGEERRVFYVAMTRAREKVYFITNNKNKSNFIVEIEEKNTKRKKCPKCKKGQIIERKRGRTKTGDIYIFYGCTNYVYGCDYSYTEYIKEET